MGTRVTSSESCFERNRRQFVHFASQRVAQYHYYRLLYAGPSSHRASSIKVSCLVAFQLQRPRLRSLVSLTRSSVTPSSNFVRSAGVFSIPSRDRSTLETLEIGESTTTRVVFSVSK